MTVRLVRAGWIAALLAAVALALLPTSSGAAEATAVVEQGWWNRANDERSPVTFPPPAEVDEDDLYVAGTPEGATAVAALKLTVADGQVGPTLTLTAKSSQNLAGAKLLACQTGSGWTGAQNGVWQAKPLIDCSTGSVAGIVADDEGSVAFALGPLLFADKLNVVIVAGTDDSRPAGADGSAFQVVFEKPTGADIVTSGGTQTAPPPAPTDFGGDSGSFAPPPSDSGGGGFTPAPDAGGSFDPGTSDPSPAPAAPAVSPEEQGQSATAPILQEATNPSTLGSQPIATNRDGRPYAVLLLLAAGAGFLWEQRHRNQLAADGPTEEVGGLGRFVRPRTGTPPSLT